MKKIYEIIESFVFEWFYSTLQMCRFFRYNLFPVYCPDCEYQLSLVQSVYVDDIKNNEKLMLAENKIKESLPKLFGNGEKFCCDYVYCQKCTYAKNLDLQIIEEE